MRINLFGQGRGWLPPSERARREHEAWLNRAVRARDTASLRIPVRPVREGGFNSLRSTSLGSAWADDFWFDVISRADSIR